jgi:predicted sulfurtransferase
MNTISVQGPSIPVPPSASDPELPTKESQQNHTVIVLFYKYFVSRSRRDSNAPQHVDNQMDPPWLIWLRRSPDYYVPRLEMYCKELCARLGLKGRILIAAEGVNGTLSAASPETLQRFITTMEELNILLELGQPPDSGDDYDSKRHALPENQFCTGLSSYSKLEERMFSNVDWKLSTATTSKHSNNGSGSTPSEPEHTPFLQPFPDLKVSIVKEIISTGGEVLVDDIFDFGGQHLSPSEFHECLLQNPDAVLIDVRNTFEHAIGHFVHPVTGEPALNPEMVTFSSFDATFAATHAKALVDKPVLLYCTGGIRCEKASVWLKQRGVSNVSQLSGGIHRYLEQFGDTGCFQGKNFVFDQRVAQTPSECHLPEELPSEGDGVPLQITSTQNGGTVVGRCIECHDLFDELCGSRLCTVCRDLVLICPFCRVQRREYHCARHEALKTCYFTFLEIYTVDELEQFASELQQLRDTMFRPPAQHRNVRRTLSRQLERIASRIQMLETGLASVEDRAVAPRRCRTCLEPSTVCDGRCWGFWKTTHTYQFLSVEQETGQKFVNTETVTTEKIATIEVGDCVEPGPDWNELRLGSRFVSSKGSEESYSLRRGTVKEIKTWGVGSTELDCVAVYWDNIFSGSSKALQIYRWGVVALNGKRLYDLRKVPRFRCNA